MSNTQLLRKRKSDDLLPNSNNSDFFASCGKIGENDCGKQSLLSIPTTLSTFKKIIPTTKIGFALLPVFSRWERDEISFPEIIAIIHLKGIAYGNNW